MSKPDLVDTLRLTVVYNPGAAFGIDVGEHSRCVLRALTIAAIFSTSVSVRTVGRRSMSQTSA